MTLLKQAMAILGTVLTIAVLVAIISPKTAHAVVASLVQIEAGNTTHVGQNEGQLVELGCGTFTVNVSDCLAMTSAGTPAATSAYAVPSGYTLIVTDWEYSINPGENPANGSGFDTLSASSTGTYPYYPVASSASRADINGYVYGHEHYITGVRVGSGQFVLDLDATKGIGFAYVQGYLVPN